MIEYMRQEWRKTLGSEKFMGLMAKEKNNSSLSPWKIIGTNSLTSSV